PVRKKVRGLVKNHFNYKEGLNFISIDSLKMEFSEVKINGNPVKFKATDKEFLLFEGYKKGENLLEFNYEAFPTQAMYFVQKDNYQDVQVWTQGQGHNTSNWLPSFDDVNEKLV